MRIWGGDCIKITGIIRDRFDKYLAPAAVAGNLAHLVIRELARGAIYPYLQIMLADRDVWFAMIPRDVTLMILPMLPTGDMFAGFPHNFLPPMPRSGGEIVEHMEFGAPHTGPFLQMTYDYFTDFAIRYVHGEQTYSKATGIVRFSGETYFRNGYLHGWSIFERDNGVFRKLYFMGTLRAKVAGDKVTYFRNRIDESVEFETIEGEFDPAEMRRLCF